MTLMGIRREGIVLGLFVILFGAITVLNPIELANAGGPVCPPDKVTVSLQFLKDATARFDASTNIHAFEIQENCTPNNGPPEFTSRGIINIDGCLDIIELAPSDFKWSLRHATLTLDNTNCGDIFVEWFGDGNNQGRSGGSETGDNCNDGKRTVTSDNKFQKGIAILWVNGVEFDTTDEGGATLEKRMVTEKICNTGSG